MSSDDDEGSFSLDLSGWIEPDEETKRRLADQNQREVALIEEAADAEIRAFFTEEAMRDQEAEADDAEPESPKPAPEPEQPPVEEATASAELRAVAVRHGMPDRWVEEELWRFRETIDLERPQKLLEITERELLRREARRAADARESEQADLPAVRRLADFLAEPDDPITYRVDRLWPIGGRVVLAAPNKTGKSTLAANLVRSLADGEPFLGGFTVERAKRVILLDAELDERMLRRWLRDQGVEDTSRIDVVPMRGSLSTFNVLNESARARWAAWLGQADVLIVDCLRPFLDALGLSEDKDAGRFLEALDELLAEAGIAEAVVLHHMGHTEERARGDSRILDWPDAVWRLITDDDKTARNGRGNVYLTAYGRDVDLDESLLTFDPVQRRLVVTCTSRRDHRADGALGLVLDLLPVVGDPDHKPMSGRQIEEALDQSEVGRNAVRDALRRGQEAGEIVTSDGPRRSRLHARKPSSAPVRRTAAH